jgi:xanthine dehydrogenase accessory factor
MKDIYLEILNELKQGREVILATIVRQKGSAPRTQGTQFLVRRDGTFLGSIGGGRLEADVLAAVPQVFQERKNRLLPFRLKGEEVAQTEMICGGEVDVYLELFSHRNPTHLDLWSHIQEACQAGDPAVLATLIEDGLLADREESKFLFRPDNGSAQEALIFPFWLVSIREQLQETAQGGHPQLKISNVEGKDRTIYFEPLLVPSYLYIFGAGHISLYVCTLAKLVGFQVAVFDDRSDFASQDRFPEADEIVAQPFEKILHDHPIQPQGFIVIVTRGHLHDHLVLKTVLGKACRYVGMIGSRHKRAVVFKALREEGFSEELLGSIHSPIGLDINAETPEEIAVSIVAELIQVRGQGRNRKKNWKV